MKEIVKPKGNNVKEINIWFVTMIVVVLILIACIIVSIVKGNPNSGYQLSEPVYEEGYIRGKLKNVSNTQCKKLWVTYEYSSGSLKEEGNILVDSPKKGETVDIEELLFLDTQNIDYTFKFKGTDCFEKY